MREIVILVCGGLLLGACDFVSDAGADAGADIHTGGASTDDQIDLAELPWSHDEGTLPPCDAPFGDFAEPVLAAPEGDIALIPSAALAPTGVEEYIDVEVRVAGRDGVDEAARGALVFDAGDGAQVLEVGAVVAGRAHAVVRFDAPGPHALLAAFVDETGERTGTAQVLAFAPRLPIWEMTIDPDDLATIWYDPYEKIKVPAVLTVDGEPYETEVRLHGGSSRDYPKKSFRFDLGQDLALPDTHDHIILRAEWNDKSMLRNYLGLEVIRDATWLCTPRAEMVHFRINRQYYGVMWRVERIGGDFLRIRGLDNDTASMYEADPSRACAIPGGNLTPLSSKEEYRCVYDEKKGVLDYEDLLDLIEGTLQLSDADFEAAANDVMNVNDMLLYFAVMAVIQNHDHIKKNYYLYRNPDETDDRWTIFPWDLELTFGHLWTEEMDVLDEQLFTDEPLEFGVCPGFCNQLLTRLYEVPGYQDRFYEMVGHIIETSFNADFIDELIDNALCRATPDLLADSMKRATNDEYLDRVDELRAFVQARRTYILEL